MAIFVARGKILHIDQKDFGRWAVRIPTKSEMVQAASVGGAVPLVPNVKVIGHGLLARIEK
jgi:hypothetical protein